MDTYTNLNKSKPQIVFIDCTEHEYKLKEPHTSPSLTNSHKDCRSKPRANVFPASAGNIAFQQHNLDYTSAL